MDIKRSKSCMFYNIRYIYIFQSVFYLNILDESITSEESVTERLRFYLPVCHASRYCVVMLD